MAANFLFLVAFVTGFYIPFSAASYRDNTAALCGKGDWLVYSDTKCFKLVNTLLTYDEALAACDSEAAGREPQPILTVNSQEEQNAVTALLFEQLGLVGNVWLGAKRSEKPPLGFVWLDGTAPEFTSWAPDSPSNDLQKNCSQLTSGLSRANGEWRDVSCNTRNFALCQKEQQWSSAQLRATLLQQRGALSKLRLEHDAHVIKYEALKTAHESLQGAHNSLTNNPVPLGFTYVQLRGQNEPSVIWPKLTWTEVTASYAGEFFRAAGGQSAAFGSTQPENAPRVTNVRFVDASNVNEVFLPVGGWSGWVRSGDWSSGSQHSAQSLNFLTSAGEVRPYNSAVRIWIRTA